MANTSASLRHLSPLCWSQIPLLHVAQSPQWSDRGAGDGVSYSTTHLWARSILGWRHLYLSNYILPGGLDPTRVSRELRQRFGEMNIGIWVTEGHPRPPRMERDLQASLQRWVKLEHLKWHRMWMCGQLGPSPYKQWCQGLTELTSH